jgi:hypothetical protein
MRISGPLSAMGDIVEVRLLRQDFDRQNSAVDGSRAHGSTATLVMRAESGVALGSKNVILGTAAATAAVPRRA